MNLHPLARALGISARYFTASEATRTRLFAMQESVWTKLHFDADETRPLQLVLASGPYRARPVPEWMSFDMTFPIRNKTRGQ